MRCTTIDWLPHETSRKLSKSVTFFLACVFLKFKSLSTCTYYLSVTKVFHNFTITTHSLLWLVINCVAIITLWGRDSQKILNYIWKKKCSLFKYVLKKLENTHVRTFIVAITRTILLYWTQVHSILKTVKPKKSQIL